jgi:glycerate dehydrogenase
VRIVVVDGFAADQGKLSWDELGRMGEVTVHPRTKPSEVVDRCRGADAVLTNKVVIDRTILGALPDLRYIGVTATGTNVIDIESCRARKVAVTNVPGYSTASVAQLTLALILHFTQDVARHAAMVKNGAWAAGPDYSFFAMPLTELAGKTLAVVGMGAIGSVVAAVARAHGMRVLAAQVPGSKSAARAPLDQAISEAHVVTLHCPLTEATRHMVDRRFLRRMRPDALLINTGRGPLVDEAALVDALSEGRLAGVGLDVLSVEPPPPDHPWLDPKAPWADRVVVTPHIGWGTVEARRRLISIVAANLAAYLCGERQNRVD